MVPPNSLLITRRHPASSPLAGSRTRLASLPPLLSLLLPLLLPLLLHVRRHPRILNSPIALMRVRLLLRRRLACPSSITNIVIRDMAFGVAVGDGVVVGRFGVFGDDVPGVEETGDVA